MCRSAVLTSYESCSVMVNFCIFMQNTSFRSSLYSPHMTLMLWFWVWHTFIKTMNCLFLVPKWVKQCDWEVKYCLLVVQTMWLVNTSLIFKLWMCLFPDYFSFSPLSSWSGWKAAVVLFTGINKVVRHWIETHEITLGLALQLFSVFVEDCGLYPEERKCLQYEMRIYCDITLIKQELCCHSISITS